MVEKHIESLKDWSSSAGRRKVILHEILQNKREELESRNREMPLKILKEKVVSSEVRRDFESALKAPGLSFIAEIKKASPSRGVIREDFDPVELARIYTKSGVSAVSVLTDSRYFQGSLDDLRKVRAETSLPAAAGLPILRKDFILEAYQVYESKVYGADAVLLISSILEGRELRKLTELCHKLGLCALVEIRSEEDLKKALEAGARVIGINNRDLKTFQVDISVTERLIKEIPGEKVIVSESGISTREDVVWLKGLGVDAILVGEVLMRSKNIKVKIAELWKGVM
ncbi:MAG: indole-3-glycerol phosphate synthase TrpC [Actinomycetota bacterium]